MGIASFSQSPVVSVLMTPLHTVAAWFGPAQTASRPFPVPASAPRQPHQLALPFSSRLASNFASCLAANNAASQQVRASDCNAPCLCEGAKGSSRASSRLKVVRVPDAAVGPACAGRMVISGRMADVCAELDRLAQREPAAHAH